LKSMPEKSVQTCITSPPYWGLRDYGHDGQIGLETTPEEYIAKMVEVFREVRRVLRDDGTLWLNLGDSYWSDTLSRKDPVESMWGNRPASDISDGRGNIPRVNRRGGLGAAPKGIKPKDLVGIPWRVALALQADGWWLRQDIIWHKPNPMPESITDRCTKAHEYIFLLTKSSRYYFDSTAIMEPAKYAGTLLKASDPKTAKNAAKGVFGGTSAGFSQHDTLVGDRRNRRSVWTINTKPYTGAHFATFPEKLVEPMVLAGSSEVGCCPSCGAPWMMVLDSESNPNRPKIDFTRFDDRGVTRTTAGLDGRQGKSIKSFVGWGPTCDCPEHKPVPCLVLDPFTGSGTTGAVSLRLGRNFVGCELNPEYAKLAESRILGESPPDSDESGESDSESESVFDLFGNDEG
jgi:DNA modification methylase